MALSDQLTRLAARAKELEDHAAAVQDKARSELERDVKEARESAEARADAMRETAQTTSDRASEWWHNIGTSWSDHLRAIRTNVEEKRAAHDRKSAERTADRAEADAEFAVDYAYAAVEEAEYAMLDAALARMEADELADA